MKIKNILFIIIALCVVNSAFALKVQIKNWSDYSIGIDPVWAGNPRGYIWLGPETQKFGHEFNTHLHHLKGLHVRVNDYCYYYNLDAYNLRGTGTIQIAVGDNNTFNVVDIQGYTDIVRKGGTTVNFSVRFSSKIYAGNTYCN